MQKGNNPPNVKKSSSQFLFYLEEFNKFLVDITDNKILVSLSLKELSTLQSVKSLLDEVHYLNLVYLEKENDSAEDEYSFFTTCEDWMSSEVFDFLY